MTMSINNVAVKTGGTEYYDDGFRTMIEMHKTHLINHSDTDNAYIDVQISHKYEADFYGLLGHLGIASAYHWIILRVNGYDDPREYLESNVSVIIPSIIEIDRLKILYITNHKMT